VLEHRLPRQVSVFLAAAFAITQLAAAQPPTVVAGTSFESAPDFALPWAEGSTWRLTGGPHSHTGGGRPWSSLDFAGPEPGGAYKVRAVAGGVVARRCPNLVEVRHANGWKTSYYHLKNIAVRDGQRVARGALLGYTSTRSGCGGSSTGAHVHFTIMRNGSPVNIAGLRIGGWTVREGTSQYRGCLVRGDERRCAPSARVLNFGV
jgi:LasA protease